MDTTTDKLIRDLADKLGTTGEHLWGVLVKQAPISATCDALAFVALITAVVVLALLSLNRLKAMRAAKDNGDYDAEENNGIFSFCLGLVAVILLIGSIIEACSSFSLVISGFMNPEFWALKQLLPK